jgi:hypothetical protein
MIYCAYNKIKQLVKLTNKQMTNTELRTAIKELFPQYVMSEIDKDTLGDSIFLTKVQPLKQYKDINKNSIIEHSRYIYISDEMYRGEERSFRYAIIYTKGMIRNYRCKIWYEVELNKSFVSAKTNDLLLEKIKESFV